jgi:hypothetical protein
MRRILPVLIGCVLLALPGLAQRGGHGGGGGMRGGGGFSHGGGGFRGGGGGFRGGGGGFRGGGGYRGGGFRNGGFRGGFRGRYGFGGLYGYPGYSYYPAFYGGLYDPFFGDDFDEGYNYPDYGYAGYGGYPTYSSPSPSVLIISNQAPPQPVIVESPPAPVVWNAAPTAQSKKYEEPLFLLAMNDGTIRAVLAYWVDGTTVHYVTMDHMQKQTPLGSLDRGLSERLNRERNVTFSLPG